MPRFIRRSVAPLLVGALAASALVSAGDDVLPFDGLLAQAQTPPTGTAPEPESLLPTFTLFDPDALGPADELDLDAVVREGTGFDTDSVFTDLADVGDFFDLYGYGDETRVDVAEELELVTPRDEVPAGGAVSARQAAERFLLSSKCSALFALGIREQVTRPITARIARDDEELILQLDEVVNGNSIPADVNVPSLSGVPESRVFRDEFGRVLAPPLDSTVQVGEVTVSVFDPDLIRARSPELLGDLVADAGFGEIGPGPVPPDAVVAPSVIGALWTLCLVESAREGTQPLLQPVGGQSVYTLTLDDPPGVAPDPTRSGTQIVTWLEEGIEVRVTTDFDAVSDALRVNSSVDLDTRSYLEFLADPVETAFEVASAIVTRLADPTDLLVDEAFAEPAGVDYGEPEAGAEARVKDSLARPTTLEGITALVTGNTSGTAVDTPAGQVGRVVARAAFDNGEVAANVTRRYAEPIQTGASLRPLPPDGIVQQVVWQPEYLNSDAFRDGWREGIAEASQFAVGIEAVVGQLVDVDDLLADPEIDELIERAGLVGDAADGAERRQVVEEAVEEFVLDELGIVDFVIARREGVTRTHWLAPCYSVTTSEGVDASSVIRAQLEARQEVFGPGDAFSALDAAAPEGSEVDYEARRVLYQEIRERVLAEDLDLDAHAGPAVAAAALDDDVAYAEFVDGFEEEDEVEDALRIAQCSRNNLAAFIGGFPVPDTDGNGIDDRVPENDVTV